MITLVCGVGGITGNSVVSVLAERDVAVRALVHRAERRSAAYGIGAQDVVVADSDDCAALAGALSDVEAIFFVAPTFQESEPRWVSAVLRAAEQAGVERFVYQSVLHPFAPSMPHHLRKAQSEVLVRASQLRWTILQPSMYAQTVLRMRERSSNGQLNVPYDPDSPVTVVDVFDVASCVAEVLSNDADVYGSYELAGPEVQSLRTMAATMNCELNERRKVVQVKPSSVPLPPAWGNQQRDEYALMCNEYGAYGLLCSGTTTAALLGRASTKFADVVVRDVRGRSTP